MSSNEIRSGIMASTKTDTAGTPAFPGGRTAPGEKQRNPESPGGMSRRDFLKKAGIAVGGLMVSTLVGGGIIKTIELLSTSQETPNISPSFDNNAESQIIKPGVNTTTINREELSSESDIEPVKEGEYPDLSLALPIKTVGNQEIKESILYSSGMNWMTGEAGKPFAAGRSFLIPDKGTEVITPKDAESFIIQYQDPQTKEYKFNSTVIKFYGQDRTAYLLEIRTDDSKQGLPMDAINGSPIIGQRRSYDPFSISSPEVKGPFLQKGTSIIKTTENNAIVSLLLIAVGPKISSIEKQADKGATYSGFKLKTVEDSNGQKKVAILAS